MSKKLCFLTTFILVLLLSGIASAQTETFWTDASGDHFWTNPANWDAGLPEFNPDLTDWESRGKDARIDVAAMANPVLIRPGHVAEGAWVGIGESVDTGPGVALNMTGGTLRAMEITLGE